MNAMMEQISRRLADVCREIEKQEGDKKTLVAGYNAAVKNLERQQKKLARMIADGAWSQEDLWEVGLADPPIERAANGTYANDEAINVSSQPLLEQGA